MRNRSGVKLLDARLRGHDEHADPHEGKSAPVEAWIKNLPL